MLWVMLVYMVIAGALIAFDVDEVVAVGWPIIVGFGVVSAPIWLSYFATKALRTRLNRGLAAYLRARRRSKGETA
jgi:hypothetical protein